MGGDGGCRVGKVRASTTSPMPDHKGFKLQQLVNFQKFSTLRVKTPHQIDKYTSASASLDCLRNVSCNKTANEQTEFQNLIYTKYVPLENMKCGGGVEIELGL